MEGQEHYPAQYQGLDLGEIYMSSEYTVSSKSHQVALSSNVRVNIPNPKLAKLYTDTIRWLVSFNLVNLNNPTWYKIDDEFQLNTIFSNHPPSHFLSWAKMARESDIVIDFHTYKSLRFE